MDCLAAKGIKESNNITQNNLQKAWQLKLNRLKLIIEQRETDNVTYLKGPHYPEDHKWYAEAELIDGVVVKVS